MRVPNAARSVVRRGHCVCAVHTKGFSVTTTPKTAAAPEGEPIATITHGIDSAWHSVGGWFDDFGRMQQEALRFVQRRLERELDAIAHVLSCRDATELLDLQLYYASEALADSVALGLRITALVNGSARRRYRRAAARRHARPAA